MVRYPSYHSGVSVTPDTGPHTHTLGVNVMFKLALLQFHLFCWFFYLTLYETYLLLNEGDLNIIGDNKIGWQDQNCTNSRF